MSKPRTSTAIKAERVQARVKRCRGWSYKPKEKAICRTYEFPSFPSAIRFVDLVAELAELADHHPDIDVRYNKVTLTLSTHSEGGVTEKDFELVRQIDQK